MYVVMIYYQLKKDNYEYIRVYAEHKIVNVLFNNVKSVGDIQDNIINTFYPDSIINPVAIGNYYLYGDLRLTSRFYDFKVIEADYLKDIFPIGIEEEYADFLDSNQCPYNYEVTSNINDENFNLKYISADTGYETVDDCGGFVITINQDNANESISYLENYLKNLTDISNHQKSNPNHQNYYSHVFDFFLFSTNYDHLIYIKSNHMVKPNNVSKTTQSLSIIPFNRFVTRNDFIRMVIEIIYYVFFLYFLAIVLEGIWKLLRKKMMQNYKTSNKIQNFKDSPLINKFYRFTWDRFKNDKGACLILKIIFLTIAIFIYKTILLIYLLILSIFEFMFSNFFNLIDLFSLSISVGMFIFWFHIIHQTNKIKIFTDTSNTPNTNLNVVNRLDILYNRYINWQACNLFLVFIRLIRYFKFSRAVKVVFDVFQKSKLTIMLYLLFLFVVNLGFVFFGYALFNQNFLSFKNIGSGILTLFVILAGKVHPADTMYMQDDSWRPIFFFFFLSFNFLVLLNFFYSILIEGYSETKERQVKNLGKDNSSNFFNNIYQILQGKRTNFLEVYERYYCKIEQHTDLYFENKDNLEKELNEIQKEATEKKNTSCCKRISTIIEIKQNFYKKTNQLSRKCYNLNSFKNELLDKWRKVCGDDDDENNELFQNDIDKEKEYQMKYNKKISEKVSIYHKVIVYIKDLFEVNDKKEPENDKKQPGNETTNGNKEEQPIIQSNVALIHESNTPSGEMTYFVNGGVTQGENNIINDNDINDNDKDKWKTNFFTEYHRLIDSKSNQFFKSNIFDKYYYYSDPEKQGIRKYYTNPKPETYKANRIPRFSKETNLKQNEAFLLNDFFITPSILSHHSNPLNKYNDYISEIRENNDLIENLKDKAKKIYDYLIYYFYIPDLNKEKDIYLNHYYEIKNGSIYENAKEHNLSYEISKVKHGLFNHDIINMWKENQQTQEIVYSLYYRYFIWNTLYIILFNKNPNAVKALRNESTSYKLIKELIATKNEDQIYITLINGLMDKLTNKNQQTKQPIISENNNGIQEQKEIHLNEFNKRLLFFFNNDKYMLTNDDNLSNYLMEDNDVKNEEGFIFSSYPEIFRKMWNEHNNNQSMKQNMNDLRYLFYGYNELVDNDNNRKINWVNEINNSNFLSKYLNKIDIFEFFQSQHRAQIATMLPPNKYFVELIVKKMKELLNEDTKQLEQIKTFTNVIDHFKYNRTNLLHKHNVYYQVFEEYFKDIKTAILNINHKMNDEYHVFLRNNNDHLSPMKKIIMAKFYTNLMTHERFNTIKNILANKFSKERIEQFNQKKNIINDNGTNQNNQETQAAIHKMQQNPNEDEELNNNGHKNKEDIKDFYEKQLIKNPFLWIMSLDPYDYLDLIQKIEDKEIKDFYIVLYSFLYEDGYDNKEEYYLKRKAKLGLIEKYDKYLDYVKKREEIEKKKKELKVKENELSEAIEYLKERKEQYNELYKKLVNQTTILKDNLDKKKNNEEKK